MLEVNIKKPCKSGDRQMKGTVILPRKTPCAILLSGHKKYYNFDNTFNNLQTRMYVRRFLDEIY